MGINQDKGKVKNIPIYKDADKINLAIADKIESKMNNCLCKVITTNKNRSGFLCQIPEKVLITSGIFNLGKLSEITMSFNSNKTNYKLKLSPERFSYIDEKTGINIIELKNDDKISFPNEYFDLENDINEKNSQKQSVYILYYEGGEIQNCSTGIIKKMKESKEGEIIEILSVMEKKEGGEGGPIVNYSHRVIGVLTETSSSTYGTFLKNIVEKYKISYMESKPIKKLPMILIGEQYDGIKNFIYSETKNVKSRLVSYFKKYGKPDLYFETIIKKKTDESDNKEQNYLIAEVKIIENNEKTFNEIKNIKQKLLNSKFFNKYKLNLENALNVFIEDFFNLLNFYVKSQLKKEPLRHEVEKHKISLYVEKDHEPIKRPAYNIIYHNTFNSNLSDLYLEFKSVEKAISEKCNCIFICSNNLEYLDLLFKQIIEENKDNENNSNNTISIKYSMIIDSQCAIETLDFFKNNNYNDYIDTIIIYSDNIKKTEKELNDYDDYTKIVDNLDAIPAEYDPEGLKDSFSIDINEIITSSKYRNKYRSLHKKIKEFDDKYSKELYEEYLQKYKKFIEEQSQEKLSDTNTKIGGTDIDKKKTEILINSIKIFGNFPEKKENRSMQLIKEYFSPKNDTLFRYFNFWLRELDEKTYEVLSYFISDLISSLINYGELKKKIIYGQHTFYRGLTMQFSDLLLYKQNEGGEITFPSFTSSTNMINVAKFFCQKEKQKRKKNSLFEILILINMNTNDDEIPVSIDINDITNDEDTKVYNDGLRMILPFVSYKINKVTIDNNKKYGEIELEVVNEKKGHEKVFLSRCQSLNAIISNQYVLVYNISSTDNETIIFGEQFVYNNRNKLKLKIEGHEKKLTSSHKFQNYGDNQVIIILQEALTDTSEMFYDCETLVDISDLANFNMSKVTNAQNMFSFCSQLESIDALKNWKMNNVKNTSGMFTGCTMLSNIISLENWNTENLNNTSYMFSFMPIKSLKALEKWDMSNVTDMHSMFKNCVNVESLEPLKNWNCKNVKNMGELFYGLENVENIDCLKNWDVSNVCEMNEMFYDCKNICSVNDIANWNVKNVNDARNMFMNCSSIESFEPLEKWELSDYVFKYGMFYNSSGGDDVKFKGDEKDDNGDFVC